MSGPFGGWGVSKQKQQVFKTNEDTAGFLSVDFEAQQADGPSRMDSPQTAPGGAEGAPHRLCCMAL